MSAPGPRLLLIADNLYSGVARHTLGLVQAALRRGVPTTMVFLQDRGNPPPDPEVASVPGLDFRSIGSEASGYRLRDVDRLLRELRPARALFLKGGPRNGRLVLDLLIRFRTGHLLTFEHNAFPRVRPPIGTGKRGGYGGLGLWWWRALAIDWLRFRIPVRIFVSGPWVEQTLIREWNYPPGRIRHSTYGVPVPVESHSLEERAAARAAWGIPDPALLFGTLGRLESGMKGHDLLLTAFATLPTATGGVPVHLVIVGAGPDRDALEAQAAALGLGARVHFVGRHPDHQEAYRALDIFVVASRYEAGPLTLLEAMAAALPCITTDVGLAAEAIPDDGFGWRVPPGSAEALAGAMDAAITASGQERGAIGRRSRERIAARFEEGERMDSLVGLLLEPL